jgi:hypothetical protein
MWRRHDYDVNIWSGAFSADGKLLASDYVAAAIAKPALCTYMLPQHAISS